MKQNCYRKISTRRQHDEKKSPILLVENGDRRKINWLRRHLAKIMRSGKIIRMDSKAKM